MSVKEASIIYLGYVVPFSAIIPLLISIVKFTKLPKELRVVGFYAGLSITSSIIVTSFAFYGINNMPVIHLYTLSEFIVIALFYYHVFTSPSIKRIILYAVAFYVTFFVVDISFFESIYDFNNYNKSVESIIVIILSIFYFIMSLDGTSKQTKSNTSINYIIPGILVYFSSSLTLFVVLNINPEFVNTQIVIWNIHASLLLLMFILFSIGLWKYR